MEIIKNIMFYTMAIGVCILISFKTMENIKNIILDIKSIIEIKIRGSKK